jgi:hypothetical protein
MGNIRRVKRRIARKLTLDGKKPKLGGGHRPRNPESRIPWRKHRRKGGGSRSRSVKTIKAAHRRKRG